MNKYASRRFLLASLSVILSAVLLWYGKISADNFTDLAKWSIGLYLAANTAQKVKGTATTFTEIQNG